MSAAATKNHPSSKNQPYLKVVGLHKFYDDFHVLKGIDFSANEHEVVTLIGSSGSGKSTLLRCLNLLEIPQKGFISIDQEDLPLGPEILNAPRSITNAKKLRMMRAKLGMVFQSFNLWEHMNILENAIYAPIHALGMDKEQATEEAVSYLKRVGLEDRIHYYPSQLSGGQKQRAAIARALVMDPKLMLFDEPTSALDPEMVGEVLRVIRDLAEEGRTMVMVTHEMGFARSVSTNIIYLNNGIIAEQGDPETLFKDPQTEECRNFLESAL